MVFGIGEGSIEIVLEKHEFAPGETIRGTVKLNLNSPKEARGLRVEFYGEKQEKAIHSSRHNSNSTVRVFQVAKTLAEKGKFASKDYPFEIEVPASVILPNGGGMLGFFTGIFTVPVKYYVSSSLDLPMSFDISKKVQVSIEQPKQQ